MRHISWKFFKYLMGSGFFAGLDILLLYVFTEYVGLYHIASSGLSFMTCLILGFLYQKNVTFGDTGKGFFPKLMKFAIYQIIAYFIYVFILWLGTEKLELYYIYVAVFGKGVTFVWNFLMNAFFNFTRKSGK